jgi:FMN reductase
MVVQRLTGSAPVAVVDLADFGPDLLDPTSRTMTDAKRTVLGADDLLVVATPTYKGTYTGILKVFLDQFAAGELAGRPTVAMMLGAGMQHALAPELSLRPVLVEIGASCPWPGLFLLDSEPDGGLALEAWLERVRETPWPEITSR